MINKSGSELFVRLEEDVHSMVCGKGGLTSTRGLLPGACVRLYLIYVDYEGYRGAGPNRGYHGDIQE